MLTRRSVLATGSAFAALAPARLCAAPLGGVKRRAPGLDALIDENAVVGEITSGFVWAEGPVWVENGRYLLFSDVPANVMYRWSEAEGLSKFLSPSGYSGPPTDTIREGGSNGLALDLSGALVYADSGDRGLTRLNLATRKKEIFLDRFDGKRFNSPNDLVVARNGSIYFTDPPYGLAGLDKSPLKEMPFSGVYLRRADGSVAVVDSSFAFPNGIGLSPDQSTLYVSNSDDKLAIIRAYTLGSDGLPARARTFFDATAMQGPNAPGITDGLKVAPSGHLFASGPGGIMVISPGGELLGVIGAGQVISNCAFGDKTLFMTSKNRVVRIALRF